MILLLGGDLPTVEVTDYSKQNWFVFECVYSEMGLGPENTTFTFCVTNSIASDAVSAVQALPACTLAHLIILRGDQGVMCKQTGLGQHNLGGPVICWWTKGYKSGSTDLPLQGICTCLPSVSQFSYLKYVAGGASCILGIKNPTCFCMTVIEMYKYLSRTGRLW